MRLPIDGNVVDDPNVEATLRKLADRVVRLEQLVIALAQVDDLADRQRVRAWAEEDVEAESVIETGIVPGTNFVSSWARGDSNP